MLTRVLTSILLLVIVIPIAVYGGLVGTGIMFAVMSAFCIYEMLTCCGLMKQFCISIPSIAVSALCVYLPVLLSKRIMLVVAILIALIPICLIFFLFVGVVKHKVVNIERLLMFFTLAVYITAGFTSLSVLNVVRPVFGLWAVIFVFAVAWCTDTFAYFGGMLFGKHKLCPNVSPKKTVEGAIVGTVFGTLAGVVVFWIAHGSPVFGIFALPISIVSQFGDLSASIIKRYFGVKDYGKLFPGHGGMVDRLDSIIPASIVSTVMLFTIVILYNYINFGTLGF